MNKFHFASAFTLISLFIFSSCSGPKSIYNIEYPLTGTYAVSQSGQLSVLLPEEWYAAEDDKFDLWLISNDLSNTIIFERLNIEKEVQAESEENELKQIILLSKAFRKVKYGVKFIDLIKDEIFSLNGSPAGAYEYTDGTGRRKRVVIFNHNNKYYEAISYVKPPIQESNLNTIFSIQNSVLNSIK